MGGCHRFGMPQHQTLAHLHATVCFHSTSHAAACPIASGYTFYPLVEWQGDEVARLSPATLASLAAKCNR